MKYSKEEVLQYIREEDVKFIRLIFCDIFGRQKNISIMPGELERAFSCGIAFDASAITGFGDEAHSDLFLHPEPDTLSILPWRPEHGQVVRIFCHITYADGTPFPCDTRSLLKEAAAAAEKAGVFFDFGPEMEFYLFRLDDDGQPTRIPYDNASYMDMAPEDKCENIRREICLTLERMGISPESSHHEEGPGQNEIDFRYSDPLTAADNTMTFQTVVKTIAQRNGLYADFSPKPMKHYPGNGFHINLSARTEAKGDALPQMMAGIMKHIADMTVFLNPTAASYERLGTQKAPGYITWSCQNRSQLIRVPASPEEHRRAELRSPDPSTNPYLAFALLIYSGLEGITHGLELPPPVEENLFTASAQVLRQYAPLPQSRREAAVTAANSTFLADHLPADLLRAYLDAVTKEQF
ncbi:glutamine synthetase [Anaerotignum lactatifermentans]|uniref:Glutamine synthetase n=1 Tax=Anaerotignum lactatifermentans TaxID=160404 RepID=A0ABS2G9D4_9FIRM|nr:glutamine synthetase family protein [Anaerotignum lactatifermentans]MBM6829010.1 glutamine synthetase [Anaerotignum lactatifermentans]MBM6877383.1 glutamine synthetase [Anaerotignum lactatifermentans]MBM6950753.1 glutamine synthetase [Anaerotignum lactatifermentans]